MPEYIAYLSEEQLSEVDRSRLRDQIESQFGEQTDIWEDRIAPHEEKDSTQEGYTFDWMHLLPVVDLVLVMAHAVQHTDLPKEIEKSLKDYRARGEIIRLNTVEMCNNPEHWTGPSLWKQLSSEAREDLTRAYCDLDSHSIKGAILNSYGAAEHCINEWYRVEVGADHPESVTDIIDTIDQHLSMDASLDLVHQFELLQNKRQKVQEHNELLSECDAVQSVLSVRKIVKTLYGD